MTGMGGSGDVVLGVTESPATGAREWATRRAESRGTVLREVVVGPARSDVDEVIAALGDAEILVLPGSGVDHHHDHLRALIAGAGRPVAIVPDGLAESGAGIVVGVDESDVSARALAFAAAEADRQGVPLTALAAWEPVPIGAEPGIDMWTGPMPIDLSEATAALLERMLEPVRRSHPGLDIRARVEVGSAAQAIADASEHAALTVVGSHGRTGLTRLLLGSVSEQVVDEVVDHVRVPTVVVP